MNFNVQAAAIKDTSKKEFILRDNSNNKHNIQ